MPRPDSEKYELSPAEKRDLVKLIEQGKPLPEKYRFILFEDKREVELVWNGKSREVSTAILPFQTLEHIDEPRKEKRDDEEFSFDTRGRQLKGWTNKLILAEAIAADLKEGKSEVVCEQGKLIKLSKNKEGVITRDVLTKRWTDWVDYWAVDFDYESRKEIIKVAKNLGVEGALPGTADPGELLDFEERWTGAYIFENEWQSFRTRQSRDLEMTTASHTYAKPGRYIIAVKVIDIFGNDTMTLVPVTVG